MSNLWTPGGEHVGEQPVGAEQPKVSEADLEAKMAELRRQLAEAPAEVVIANHCFGLFELAALHLSLQPPKLPEAQLAIDALGAVIEGLAGRLGDEEQQLRDGLAQLRIAFVQIKTTAAQSVPESGPTAPDAGTE